jgi:hypothetical protein
MTLPEDITLLDLSIYWFNHGTNQWERVSGVQNDLEKRELSVQLQHFSEYQVMASQSGSSQYDPPSFDALYKMGVSNYVPYFKDNVESISPSAGNLTVIATDLKLPGRAGFDLILKRQYDSNAAEQDIIWRLKNGNILAPIDTFGVGWSLNIPWLETNYYGTYVKFPEGYRVKLDNMNDFTYHQGIHFNFKKVTNGSDVKYVLTLKDGSAYEFKTDGRVIKYSDPTGKNVIQFTYKDQDGKGSSRQLDAITDSIGRKVKFTYALIPGSSSIYTISQISTGITKE